MVYIGSDHGGFELKGIICEYLSQNGLDYYDCGAFEKTRIDYPDIAKTVCLNVLEDPNNKGILICGTGIGMSMCANKFSGIRAAVCSDTYSSKMTRLHNDANIICMGQRVVGNGLAIDIVETFLNTQFEGGRHQKRIEKIEQQ